MIADMRRSLALVAVVGSLVSGCAKEAGRVPFSGEGTAASTMTLKAGEVDFWTEIDIDWEGDASLAYKIDLAQGGKVVASATCNPLGRLHVKTSWVETNIGDKHSRRGNGKMDCTVSLPSAGATEVRAHLAFAKKPPSVTLKKADLSVRQ